MDSNQSNRFEVPSQPQSNLMTTLKNCNNAVQMSRTSKLGLREVKESERNISNNSRIKMGKSKHERELTPSRIINSSKNTRLSNQVVVAKGDISGLQFEKVHVNSLMEESKKLNNMDYDDSSCSGVFDQGLQ